MFKQLDRITVNLVLFFVLIAYFQLFKFLIIPSSVRAASQFLAIALMFSLILLKIIYHPEHSVKMNFAAPILLLMVSAIPSYFVAIVHHNQSFLASLSANHVLWFYLLYFFAHYYKVSPKYVIRLIVVAGLFVVALFYVQLLLYPKLILEIYVFESRGTVRLLIPGMLCAQLAYFYYLNLFLKQNRLKDFFLSLAILSIFMIQGSRQLILALFFLTLIMLFFSDKVKGRSLKVFVLGLASVAVFFVFRDIFLELTKVSSSQIHSLGEGVRIKAARFFLTTFQSDEWSYIFGNSRGDSGGQYYQRMQIYSLKYGFFLSDIGILGDYVRYGILFVVAGSVLILKSLRFKVSTGYSYLKYYIVMQCFTLATGKGFLGGVDIILLLILYVFDVDRSEQASTVRNDSPVLINAT